MITKKENDHAESALSLYDSCVRDMAEKRPELKEICDEIWANVMAAHPPGIGEIAKDMRTLGYLDFIEKYYPDDEEEKGNNPE